MAMEGGILSSLMDEGKEGLIKPVVQLCYSRFKPCQGRVTFVLLFSSAAFLSGCAYLTGPSDRYPATTECIRTRMAEMKASPKGVSRPVIVIDGWLPAGGAGIIRRELVALTGATNGQIIKHSYLPACSTIESNARKVIEKIEKRWPNPDPEWTVEVDAVGYSMGGLIGRMAALEPGSGTKPRKRLRIRTLYTISSPHGGVGCWLGWIFLDEMSFKTSLYASGERHRFDATQAAAEYELLCYAQSNDWVVGENTAPPGYQSMRAKGTVVLSHSASAGNLRHIADIAARLRGEAPLLEAPPPQ
jgi:hypothetical protein